MFEKKPKPPERFAITTSQTMGTYQVNVLVDKQTGVNYLALTSVMSTDAGTSVTPMLDASGRVLVTPVGEDGQP